MINLVSYNANGLASTSKAANFLSLLSDPLVGLRSPDVLFLQETHLNLPPSGNMAFLNSTLFGSAYTIFHAHATPSDTHAGVAIAIKSSDLLTRPTCVASDRAGRWLHAQVTLKNMGKISLLCVYAPASASPVEREQFFDSLPWS